MKIGKKKIALLLSLALGMGSLAGCGQSEPAENELETGLSAESAESSVTADGDGAGQMDPSGSTKENNEEEGSWDKLLEEAYVYTLPLMLVDATMTKMTNTIEPTSQQAPANQLIHAANLATAEARNVVTPNVDTIYSQVFLDLSEDGVVLTLPKTDRFAMAEILDAYTNCTALIDMATFEEDRESYLFTGPDFEGAAPEGATEIKCPTNMAWIIIRTVCQGDEDVENVHEIQGQMDVCSLSSYVNGTEEEKPEGTYREENNFIPVEHVLGLSMEEYFSRANELMEENPPFPEDAPLLECLEKINVGPGLTFDGSVLGENADEQWTNLVSQITEICTDASRKFMVQNGNWNYFGSPIAEFGTEYYYRALVALAGLGANPVSVAVYPKTIMDTDGGRLNGEYQYILHFDRDGFPEMKEQGFWSITMYRSEDNLLVENEIDRYCINDRSQVVYGADGSLDLYIQKERPNEEEVSNWLPAPEGDFHLFLRVYLPGDSVVNNEWQMPEIRRR